LSDEELRKIRFGSKSDSNSSPPVEICKLFVIKQLAGYGQSKLLGMLDAFVGNVAMKFIDPTKIPFPMLYRYRHMKPPGEFRSGTAGEIYT
jgi:hypothetical protein